MKPELLFEAAKKASEKAYAPYSQCRVGAALLTERAAIYTGCNVECASYPLTVCAERNAVSAAICGGERNFVAIAVYSGAKEEASAFPPCGACRQVLAEFCDASTFRIFILWDGGVREYFLKDLLPYGFSPKHLNKGDR